MEWYNNTTYNTNRIGTGKREESVKGDKVKVIDETLES